MTFKDFLDLRLLELSYVPPIHHYYATNITASLSYLMLQASCVSASLVRSNPSREKKRVTRGAEYEI